MQVDSFVDKNNECVDNRRSSDNGPSKTITELGVYEGMWMAESYYCVRWRRTVITRRIVGSLYAVVGRRIAAVWSC